MTHVLNVVLNNWSIKNITGSAKELAELIRVNLKNKVWRPEDVKYIVPEGKGWSPFAYDCRDIIYFSASINDGSTVNTCKGKLDNVLGWLIHNSENVSEEDQVYFVPVYNKGN